MDEYRIRVRIYAGVILTLFLILGARLAQLQLIDPESSAVAGNAVRERPVEAARGAIYGRDGTLLADNRPSYTIRLTPRYFDRSKIPLLADRKSVV